MDAEDHKTPDQPSDCELARRTADGDDAAFETLCARLEGPLYGYSRGIVRHSEEAEDIVQETLLRLYRMARQGGLHAHTVRSLVFGIAHNLAIDHLRRLRRASPYDDRRVPKADRSAREELLREEIDRALGDVPESQRAALLLREFGGLSYAEIASSLGISLNEVKIRIHRARKRLAQLLDRDGQYIGESQRGM